VTGTAVEPAAGLPTDIPRANGELVFDAPWEGRAFGLAAAYVEARGCGWDRFRTHLIAAITRLPDDTPYYEAWVAAVEDMLAEDGVATADTGQRP
jgi:nitrile hydratase accessory protein